MHVDPTPGADERAFVALYNPSAGPLPCAVDVPLYYAGFAPGASVSIWRVFPGPAPRTLLRTAVVGADGGGVYDIHVSSDTPLGPESYAFFTVTTS